ncbi:MAG: MFS transporter [Lentisphaerae bacterium]|nr:MFS transporter [Lentisphaerota bacterium]
MSSFVESLTAEERRQSRRNAYASTWFGCFADLMHESSALIILYLAMLGSSGTLTMLCTSLSGIVSVFLLIPMSSIIDCFGVKRIVLWSCLLGCLSFFVMGLAPFFSYGFGPWVVLFSCFVFFVSKTLWIGCWYPILTDVLLPEERGDFFGLMRFSYHILALVVFFLLGLVMGKNPPFWLMQTCFFVTGILLMGRYVFVSRIRISPHVPARTDIRRAFRISVQNGPLVGFSNYICFVLMAFSSVLPLSLLYLKKGLAFDDNMVQLISTSGIGGSVIAYLLYGWLCRKLGVRNIQLCVHVLFIVLPLALFFLGGVKTGMAIWMTLILFIGNFAYACFCCVFSQEALALARPGNSTMATAFSQTYQMIGIGIGRLFASMMLDNGILSSHWKFFELEFNHYQTLFLLCGLGTMVSLCLVFLLPSVVPKREDYYNP